MPPYPVKMFGGVGGIINGDHIIVCGGSANNNLISSSCYTLQKDKKWHKAPGLRVGRIDISTGSIVLQQGLWISGGRSIGGWEASTEIVGHSSSQPSMNMPFGILGHCSVLLDRGKENANKIFSIGGNRKNNHFLSETFIWNSKRGTWENGPSMNRGRYKHGCGIVELGAKKFIFVTGGFQPGYFPPHTTSSTEFLDLSNIGSGWKNGNILYKNAIAV